MSYNFNLEGMQEHRVQTDVIFKLKVVDETGAPADPKPPPRVEATLAGTHDSFRGEVSYSPGCFTIKFFPGATGMFEMNVKVNGRTLYSGKDSVVNVTDGKLQHLVVFKFECEGTGFVGGQIGEIMHVTIKPKEKDGSPKELGDDRLNDLELRVGSGTAMQKIKPHRINEATYLGEYKVETPGFYEVDVHFEGKSVLKHTERPYFTSPASPKNTKAVQVPKGMVTVGEKTSFTIQARNGNDLNIKSGGDVFKIACDGPGQLQDLVCKDQNNGQYEVSFTPPETGVYQFDITLNDMAIGNSPVKVIATRR